MECVSPILPEPVNTDEHSLFVTVLRSNGSTHFIQELPRKKAPSESRGDMVLALACHLGMNLAMLIAGSASL